MIGRACRILLDKLSSGPSLGARTCTKSNSTLVEYLNALEEEKFAIGNAAVSRDDKGRISEDFVEVRKEGKPMLVKREDVDFMEVATNQPFSVATSLITFVENDDANRALM